MKVLVVLLLILLIPVVSTAEEADPFQGRLIPVELIMSERQAIDLTKDQHREIGKLVVDVQQKVAGHQWELTDAYFELLDALDQETIDEELAVSLVEQAVSLENKVKVEQMRDLFGLQ